MVKLGFISSQFANNLEMIIEKWGETESESETAARVNGTEKRILHFFEIHWISIELGKPIVREWTLTRHLKNPIPAYMAIEPMPNTTAQQWFNGCNEKYELPFLLFPEAHTGSVSKAGYR